MIIKLIGLNFSDIMLWDFNAQTDYEHLLKNDCTLNPSAASSQDVLSSALFTSTTACYHGFLTHQQWILHKYDLKLTIGRKPLLEQ